MKASVTLLEATTPVKLPAMHCLQEIRQSIWEGWYFNNGSPMPGDTGSKPPTYPTHPISIVNAKL